MKRQNRLYWSLLMVIPVLMGLAGCQKFLDRKPLSATLDDLNGKLEGQVLGMYNILRTYGGFSLLPWIDFHSIRGDDAQKGSDASDGREIFAEFETYKYSKDDWAPNGYWNDHYAMINSANAAVDLFVQTQPTDNRSKYNLGEACFFRAYAYFELVKTYGDVPLFKASIVKPTDGVKDKSPAAEVYAFIDSNLQVAVDNLPLESSAYGENFKGRLVSSAARALWAQAYLFRKDWANVIAQCNAVISTGLYSLSPDFSDAFREGLGGAYKNGPESIFEMQPWVGANGQSNPAVENGSDWGTSQQVRQNGAPVEWNLGWGWNAPTDELVNSWDDTDPRKARTILYSGQFDGGQATGGFGATVFAYTNADGTGGLAQKYWNKKMYTGNTPELRSYTGFINQNGAAKWISHRILRYNDLILMLAEASNEIGDGATAATNVELIRDRASGNQGSVRTVLPPIAFVSQDQMRAVIKDERKHELAMEGYRFYDLVRWGDADSVLAPLGYTNRARFYPIPQKAIDLTGGVLKQNPEW